MAHDPNTQNGLSQNLHTNHEETVKTGFRMGRLLESARIATGAALDRRLLEDLRRVGVGTMKIETEALRLGDDASKYDKKRGKRKKGGKVAQRIREERDPDKVMDLLKIKIKYCIKEEKRSRKE